MTPEPNIALEFSQICKAVAVGFAVMGFIGYFVKLIHIPMYVANVIFLFPLLTIRGIRNNILVYVLAPYFLSTVTHRSRQRRRIGPFVICIYHPFRIIYFIQHGCRDHTVHASFRNKVLAGKSKAFHTQEVHYLSPLDFATLRGLKATSRPWIGV